MECIRNGDVRELLASYTDEMYSYYAQSIPDVSLLPFILTQLNSCLLILAHEGGLPLTRAAAVSTKCFRMAPSLSDINEFVDMLRRMQIDFAREVFLFRQISSGNQTIDHVLRYINDHIYEKIELQTLAKISRYSTSRLQHLFREHTGSSISDRIRQEKIRRACFLLKTTKLTSAEISQKLSFCSQSYFIRQFRREIGTSPEKYRAEACVAYEE